MPIIDSAPSTTPAQNAVIRAPRTTETTSTSTAGEFSSAPIAENAPKSEKEQFLRLLVAQLQHQDPLSPQDGAAFIAQLAQFASLEQSAETNQRLADIQSSQAASLHAGYSNLVGRTVSAHAGEIELPAEAGTSFSVHLDAPAETTDVVLFDENGKEVKTINLGKQSKGDAAIELAGVDLPPGSYRVEVRAKAADGSSVEAHTRVHALIDSVSFEGGSVRFRIGELEITPGDIITIER